MIGRYNDKGQPNLHIHILLTLRPLNEDGTWGAKSRKEYVLDADGNRIPNASGKGYKSRKVNVIDWNEKDKAKEWRNAIAEVINATNEKAGIAERVDPRSYKDRGIPLIPTIHLGERASALERKGIRTERGNINRAIEKYNAMIMKIYGFISELKEELKKGVFKFVFERKSRTEKDGIQSINPSINASVPEQKPEVQTALEMLQKQRSEMVVRPIFTYVQRFKDKRLLGNVELLAKLLDTNHLETWEDVRAFEEKQTEVLENCRAELSELSVRYEKWTQAVSDYDDYKQYQPVMKEYQALSGLRKNSFKKKHETELENYAIYWIYPTVQDEEAYGHYLIDELDELELPEAAKNYFMYEEYGRDAVKNDGGIFTAQGYIYNNKNTFSEWYSGHENDIPKEYRVMSFPKPERPDPAKVEMDAAAPPQQSVPPDAAQEPRPVIPIVLTSEKPADKLKEITDRLEQGIMELFDSDRYKEYLRVMSKFHNYSFNNTLLIAMQKPDASLVAGFQSWKNNFKRNVVKGEKGIKILAPSPFKIQQEMEKIDPATQKPVIGADGKPVKEEKEITIPAFKVVSVFDVSQTEGKELPDIAVDMLTGDVERFKDVFAALEKTSPVPIGFEKIEGNSHGYYHLEEKRIAIDEGMSELQTIKTAIYEIAHAKLHDIDPNAPKEEQAGRPDRRTREVQAESVAYAVCQHYGLDTSDYSFGYVAGWSSGRELDELKSSLETIRSTAAEIINSIDEHLQEIQKERDKEQVQKETVPEVAALDKDTFSIYQLKRGDETRDFRFEPYDRLAATGRTADQANYDLIYTAELTPGTSLEDIYTRFNIDHPKDFRGRSLSISDVVVLHQNGQDTAHYVDSSGYRQVPEFLQPPEKENPLKHVEDTIEQNDNNFDGIINNTPSVDELEKKAKSGEQISLTDLADAIKAEKTRGMGKEEKPSIRAQLKADKKKVQKKTARQKPQDLERS